MASLIPAGLQIVGGLLNKSSKGKEAAGVLAAGAEANAQLQPFTAPGAEANQTILNALSGGAGAEDAFAQFQKSTGFQSQLSAGSAAIVGNQATRGLLNSGSTLKRQTKFGQDLAQGGFQNFLANLSGVANRGASTATAAADITRLTGTEAARTRSAGSEALQTGIGAAFQTAPVQNFFGNLNQPSPVGG